MSGPSAENDAPVMPASALCGSHIGHRIEHPWAGHYAKRDDGEWRHDGFGTISMIQHKKNGETKVRCSEGGVDLTFAKGASACVIPPASTEAGGD
jgi:hypothetical protein